MGLGLDQSRELLGFNGDMCMLFEAEDLIGFALRE
jgi:hypothetical protein